MGGAVCGGGPVAAGAAGAVAAVRGIGLAGQMHGAVLLDSAGAVLRPAILWNDVRAAAECAELERLVPGLRGITGNLAMPGFTAPKLLWVARHEPDVFARTRTVVLPKAYIRYRMTGELIEEMSDASGTLWLDTGRRDWSDEVLAATGLSRAAMPRLVEGNAAAGTLLPALAAQWGLEGAPVVAGAPGIMRRGRWRWGDSARGCVRVVGDVGRAVREHRAVSAVSGAGGACVLPCGAGSVASDGGDAVGGGFAGVVGGGCRAGEAELLAEVGVPGAPSEAVFLPYLGGERTPHNDGGLRAGFAGCRTGRTGRR